MKTFVTASILKAENREIELLEFNSIIDYMQFKYPNGFEGKNCTVTLNTLTVEIQNWDAKLNDGDIIIVLFRPAIAVGVIGGSVVTFLANLAISVAVSYIVGQLFRPSIPERLSSLSTRNSRGKASSVYSLNAQQNEAKRGEVIPIIYGKIRTYPALISPSYYRYENNEEFLYQLMCIGQGTFNIDEMLISDTNVSTIQDDYFRYEKLEYDDFKTVGGISAKVNDSNYVELVKAIPDIENLEVRGAPQNKRMVLRFENDTITFYPFADGSEPDLSSLSQGSTITISGSVSNNGSHIVVSVLDNVVKVQSDLVTEPNNITIPYEYKHGGDLHQDNTTAKTSIYQAGFNQDMENIYEYQPTSGIWNTENGTVVIHKGIQYQLTQKQKIKDNPYDHLRHYISHTIPSFNGDEYLTSDIEVHAKHYNAEFETSYGSYTVREEGSTNTKAIEIDYVFPNGIYNSNSSTGKLEDREIEFLLTYKYLDDGSDALSPITVSTTDKNNSPIRVTRKDILPINSRGVYINIKRITPEPDTTQAGDKLYIRSIKKLYANQNYEPLGDITLLWCKVRATNAITQAGQFSINAWVTRTDVAHTVGDVVTDLYTNATYGGRLNVSDLDLEDSLGFSVNGAIDTKITLFDALRMVSKPNRFTIYPVGANLKMKQDKIQPIRTALFNETNILKDTFKISYLFEENIETDSIKVSYRNSTDFKATDVIFPTNGIYPEVVELWGCTDDTVALDTATYLFNQDRARRKNIEFKTDIQGHIPQFLDRIAVSHNVTKWGFGGQIVAQNGNELTLSCSYGHMVSVPTWECENTYECNDVFFPYCEDEAPFDSIIFRDAEGGVSDIYTFTIINNNKILLDDTPPAFVYTGGDYDKTFVTVGTSSEIVKDYLVMSVTSDTQDTFKIKCSNYDESIYP